MTSERGNSTSKSIASSLDRLRYGEQGVLESIDLPDDDAERLMELGFLPGTVIFAARSSPFGHTRVFRIDGSEVALRRETAARLIVRPRKPQDDA